MPSSLLPRPLVYAHRGGAALRPENTIAAFDHGLALGADGLELDVRLSLDGVVVIHHDPMLDRTTEVRGAVAALSAAELARVDAGYRFTCPSGETCYRGQGIGIPTLRGVLERYPTARLIIELKGKDPEVARKTVDEVRRANALDRVAVGGYYRKVMKAARACEPRLVTGAAREEIRWALYRSWVRWPLGGVPYREFQVPERSGRTIIVSPHFIEHAHRAGVLVKVWTVDERADIERLFDWGVDGIISDRPDVAVEAVRGRFGSRA